MKQRIISAIVAALSICCLAIPTQVMAQRGEKSVGLRGGFTTRNTTASAGLYFSYRFSQHFRFAPKMDYAFRNNDTDAFSFNFDTEYPIALNSTGNVNFYPIAGLNYTTFNIHSFDPENSIDSSERLNHFGLNVGVGIEYFATPTLRLAFESKCQFVKQNTGGWFNICIGYRF